MVDNCNQKVCRAALSNITRRLWLFQLGIVSGLGLFAGQITLAQTEPALSENTVTTLPAQGEVTIPAISPSPETTTLVEPVSNPPESVEIVSPNDVVPTSIPTLSGANPIPSPAASIQESSPEASLLDESIDRSSPIDYYGSVFIDPTDYSIGATETAPISAQQISDCQFPSADSVNGRSLTCNQPTAIAPAPSQNAMASGNIKPDRRAFSIGPVSISSTGVQIPESTTKVGQAYYNQITRSIVNLQLGKESIFPLSVPATITSLFGWHIHPISGEQRFHSGIDLAAPAGTPVVAAQAGKVLVSNFLGGYGLTVILRHGKNDLESRYPHLSRQFVEPGDWVEQGEVIGLVGSTGNSTGPHLHFELRQFTTDGWVAIDPENFIETTLATLLQFHPLKQTQGNDQKFSEQYVSLPFRPAQPHAN